MLAAEALAQRIKSQEVFDRACKFIPGGVNSAARAFHGLDMTPLIAERGKGALLYDVDGRGYIDYCQSWGALILGHAADNVQNAVLETMKKGFGFGMTTELEAEFAAFISQRIPFVEKVRFVSTGTEAVMTALRMARGFTDKSYIVKFNKNYHGHYDALLVNAGSGVCSLPNASSKGIPGAMIEKTVSLPFNDINAAKEFLEANRQIAAVIVEAVAGNMGLVPAEKEFLSLLRACTKKIGALLIFDEVISGFRASKGGAAEWYQIEPDLITLGKIIGGGLPAAAIGGRKEIMDVLAPLGHVFQAGTLSGNPLAMAAGLTTLKETERENFYEELERKTASLTDALQKEVQKRDCPITIHQMGSMFTIFFGTRNIKTDKDLENLDFDMFARLYRFLFSKGIFFPPSPYETCFVSGAHTQEQINYTKETILEFIRSTL